MESYKAERLKEPAVPNSLENFLEWEAPSKACEKCLLSKLPQLVTTVPEKMENPFVLR